MHFMLQIKQRGASSAIASQRGVAGCGTIFAVQLINARSYALALQLRCRIVATSNDGAMRAL